jgi:phosphoglycerol geranylgeranyltransferase
VDILLTASEDVWDREMSLTTLAKRFESASAAVSIGCRTLLGLDTNPVPSDWSHITKVDPESEKRLPVLYPCYLSETSAVSVGGSRDVSDRNTEETFELLADSGVPAFHEPSDATHVTEKTREHSDFLAVPEVLNGDSEALVGTLGKGLDYVREDLGPKMIEEKAGFSIDGLLGNRGADFATGWMMKDAVFEAYIIMNLDSAAAREANVGEEDLLTPQEAKERALAAQHHLESEIIYLEYSGTFGGDEAAEMLDAIDDAISWSRIWYGGGLDNREDVNKVRNAGADAVVVGDVFHRVADVEADLFERARTEFDGDPTVERLREWIGENLAVGESDAGRYFSTVPEVTQPETVATRCLAASLGFSLAVADLADDLADPSAAGIRSAVRDREFEAESTLANVSGADASLVTDLACGLLADRFGVEMEERSVTDHLAIEL